ncbi:hypothetical protein PAMP_023302 [Pampus punctatissimus]
MAECDVQSGNTSAPEINGMYVDTKPFHQNVTPSSHFRKQGLCSAAGKFSKLILSPDSSSSSSSSFFRLLFLSATADSSLGTQRPPSFPPPPCVSLLSSAGVLTAMFSPSFPLLFRPGRYIGQAPPASLLTVSKSVSGCVGASLLPLPLPSYQDSCCLAHGGGRGVHLAADWLPGAPQGRENSTLPELMDHLPCSGWRC